MVGLFREEPLSDYEAVTDLDASLARGQALPDLDRPFEAADFADFAKYAGEGYEDESYKLLSSAILGRFLKEDASSVYKNWDAAVEAWSGSKIRPRDFFDRMRMSWNTGTGSVKLGNARWKWAEAASRGEDTAGIEAEIAQIKAQMPPPQEYKNLLPKAFFGATELTGQMLSSAYQNVSKGLGTGLNFAIGAATVAGIAGQAGPQIALPEEIVTIPVAAAGGFFAGLVGEQAVGTYKMEAGLALEEMLEWKDADGNGIDRDVAVKAAMGIGVLNSIIEVGQDLLLPGVGEIPAKILRKAGKSAFTKVMERGIFKAPLAAASKAIAKAAIPEAAQKAAGYLISETGQEIMQEVITIYGGEIAKEVSNQTTGTALEGIPTAEVAQRLIDTGLESALSFGLIGLPGAGMKYVRGRVGAKIAAEDQANATAQKLVAEFAPGLAAEGREAIRTPEGMIYTETENLETTEAGQSVAVVYAGDKNTGERYGYLRYRTDGERVFIEDAALEEDSADPREEADTEAPTMPLKDSMEVRRVLLRKVAEQNPGMEILYENPSPAMAAAYEAEIADNPRGKEFGVQRYAAEDADKNFIDDVADFKAQVKRVFQRGTEHDVTDGGIDLMVNLTARRAERTGTTVNEYIRQRFAGFTDKMPDMASAQAQAQGIDTKDINGSTVFADSRALIYAAEKADFRTLAHEMFHAWMHEIEETGSADGQALKDAFGVTDWTNQDRERAAYSFEKYLETGAAQNETMKPILQRIVEWMVSVYRTLAEKITVTPEIREAFDRLFSSPESPVAQAENEDIRLEAIAAKIMKGNREWSAQELQDQANNPKKIEEILARKAAEEARPAEELAIFQEGTRDVEKIVYTFPKELKGYSDIHSQAQLGGALTTFGRGVVDRSGQDIRLGAIGASHVELASGMSDAKRFYFGYSKEKKAVYVVAKNGMDEAFLRRPEVLQGILSQVFDKYKLNVAQGKKLGFQEALFQPAYHGSPHSFDRFTTEKMGSGEGNQSFGWGLYFAGSKDVADWYRKKLSEYDAHIVLSIDGKKLEKGTPEEHAARLLYFNNTQEVRKTAKEWVKQATDGDEGLADTARIAGIETISYWKRVSDFLNTHKKQDLKATKGQLYKVEIPDDGEFLNWDKPLSEQSEKVKSSILSIFEKTPVEQRALDDFDVKNTKGLLALLRDAEDGNTIYGTLTDIYVTDKEASRALKNAGIPGIRYLDGSSRGKGEGSYNYVIFDERDVQIEETFYQLSEPELADTAAKSETWQDFKAEIERDGETAPEGLTPEELDFWYQATYERLKEQAKGAEMLSPKEADDDFAESVPEKLEDFLRAIYDAMTTNWGGETPADAEEAAALEKRMANETSIRKQMHLTVINAALRLGKGEALTPYQRKASTTLMRKEGARTFYRRWYNELIGGYKVDEEADAETTIGIERLESQSAGASIEGFLKLLRSVQDEELKKKLASGEIVIEKEIAGYLGRLEEQKKAIEKELADKEAALKAKIEELSPLNRKERTREQWRRELYNKISAQTEDIRKGIDSGEINERLVMERNKNKAYLAEIMGPKASHAEVAEIAETFTAEDAIKETRDRLKEIESRKKQARQIRELKVNLGDAIMRKIPKGVAYARVKEIKAVQALVDPHFRQAKIKWLGTMIDAELLRDNPDVLKDLQDSASFPAELAARLQKKNLGEWTLRELEELAEQVDELIRNGKQERDFEILKWKAERQSEASKIINEVIKGGKYVAAAAAGSVERQKQMRKKDSLLRRLALSTTNARRIATMLDGGADGQNVKELILDRRRAYAEKMAHSDRRIAKVETLMKKLGVKAKDFYDKKTVIKGIGPGDSDITFTASDLMYISIGLNDANTREAIVFGNLFNQQERGNTDNDLLRVQGAKRLAVLQAAMTTALTDQERQVAAAIGDDFRDEFGRMNQVFVDEFNEAMAEVENYVPIIRQDVTASGEKHEKSQAEEVLNVAGVSIKRNPDKGFSIERVKIAPSHQRATKLDLYGTWLAAVEREEHFTAFTHLARKLNAVYKGNTTASRLVRDSIVNSYGAETMRYVDDYINEVANPQTMTSTANLDKLVRLLRGSLGGAYLGWKVSGMVKQAITSPMPYLTYTNPLSMTVAAFEAITNPKAFDEAVKKSAYMKHRVANPIFEAIKLAKQDPGASRLLAGFSDLGMKGLEFVDWASVSVGWKAVYNDVAAAMVKGKESVKVGGTEYRLKADPEAPLLTVYTPEEIADDVTLKSQPTADPAELAPLFKTKGKGGEFARAFTQFGTALNVIWQQFSSDLPNAIKHKQIGTAVRMLTAYAIAGILVGLVTRGKEDDDEDMKDDFLFWSFTQATDSVPIVSDLVTAIWHKIATGEKDEVYQSSLYPSAEKAYRGVINVTDGEWQQAARNFGESLGLGLGLPVSGFKELEAMAEIGPEALVGRRE